MKRIGIDLVLAYEDYEAYARAMAQGTFGDVTWDSSPLFGEVDSYLYSLYRAGAPTNRSRVTDRDLDERLDAQRALKAQPARKQVLDDVQRRVAAEVYYIYAPYPRSLASWSSWVRNGRPAQFPRPRRPVGSRLARRAMKVPMPARVIASVTVFATRWIRD